jgi:hypothetical protein
MAKPGAFSMPQGWKAVIETNLTGTFLMSREVYRQHFNQHGGAIVNIIADMFRGFPLMAHTGQTPGEPCAKVSVFRIRGSMPLRLLLMDPDPAIIVIDF